MKMTKIFSSVLLGLALLVGTANAQQLAPLEKCVDQAASEMIFKSYKIDVIADFVIARCGEELVDQMIVLGGNPMDELQLRGFAIGHVGSWSTTNLHFIMREAVKEMKRDGTI